MKKLFLPFGACLMVLLFSCSVLKTDRESESPQIPVLAWFSIPAEHTSLDRYLELKEAGFTHGFSHTTTADEVAAALDTAQRAGIKLIITCKELETDPEATVNRFKNHPALDGYFLRDEPDRTAFASLGEWARKIESADKEHYCYLNLLPTYASLGALKTNSYREYVNLFIQEVNLPFVSFDHYPVIGDSTLRGDFYENLEIISDESRKAGKPFWAFALATAHDPYPIATLASLRLQVYSNLAYGAQGIQYFTYWTPVGTIWNFNHAPITETFQRSEVYDRVREVNKEIKTLSPVFLGAKLLSVAHTGEIPVGTKQLASLPAPFEEVSASGRGVLVSELENGENHYLVIVNRDLKHSQQVTVRCTEAVSRILKDGSSVPAARYTPTLAVDAGDALIYTWKK